MSGPVLVNHALVSSFPDTGETNKFGPFAWNANELFSGGAVGEVVTWDPASPTKASWSVPVVAAGALTGATLAANVLASSLTSVGTLASLAITGSATALSFNATSQINSPTFRSNANGTQINFVADGQLRFRNNADTAGVGLDFGTDNVLKIRNRALSADAELWALNILATGTMQSAGSLTIQGGNNLKLTPFINMNGLADGQLVIRNNAGSAGSGLDVATDGVLKIRTRAHTADASLTALSIGVGTVPSTPLDISPAAGDSIIRLNRVSGATSGIVIYDAAIRRWDLYFNATTADFKFNRYSAAGAFIDQPISVAAATGTVTIKDALDRSGGFTRLLGGGNVLGIWIDGSSKVGIGPTAAALGAERLTVDGAIRQNVNAIAATSTDGVVIANDSLATVGVPVQQSPRLRFRSHVWNTTATAADNTDDWWIELVPVSGTTPSGLLKFGRSSNGAAATFPMTLDSVGILTVANAIVMSGGGSMYLPTAGHVVFGGNARLVSPANGQLNVLNQLSTAGVGLDVATDGVLKVRTRAQSAYATVDALGYSVGGVAGASKAAGPVTSITVVNGIVTAIS